MPKDRTLKPGASRDTNSKLYLLYTFALAQDGKGTAFLPENPRLKKSLRVWGDQDTRYPRPTKRKDAELGTDKLWKRFLNNRRRLLL